MLRTDYIAGEMISNKKLLLVNVRVIIKSILILVILQSSINAQKDEIVFTHLTVEDGLSLNVVTQILQDDHGFMWFGTYNGLNRYDGYNFKTFLPEASDPKSISSHSIWSMFEDSKGNIWIGTLDGLNKFDWKTETFTRYKNIPEDPHSISNSLVYSIYEDKSGTLWIGTLNGLNKYNRDQDNFTVIKKVSDRLSADSINAVKSIVQDKAGRLWLGTWDGISYMNNDGKIIKQNLTAVENKNIWSQNIISSLICDKNGSIWIGTAGYGLYAFNPKTGSIASYRSSHKIINSISDDFVNTIYQDKAGNIWVGTKSGLNKFETKTNKFIGIFHEPLKPLSIINNDILSINEDNTGIIWIGTSGGISRFYSMVNKFNYYEEDLDDPDSGLSGDRVNSVSIDRKNNLWVGTQEGLDNINRVTGKIIHFKPQPGNSNSLPNKYVMAALEDYEGTVWIGTDGGGLTRYNPVTKNFRTYKYDQNNTFSLSNNGVVSLFQDSKNNLWISTWWGLNRYDRIHDRFIRYISQPSNPNSISHNLVWVIFEDSKGKFWFGTDIGGVDEYDQETNTFINFKMEAADSNKRISGNRVISILESHDRMMWLGTTDGLNRYDRATGKITVYKKENGLPSNIINAIQEDDKGNLWISSDKGLSKFDRKANRFIIFSKRNGLKELEFTPNASAKSKSGELFFGSNNNLTCFYPDSIHGEYITAPLVFTDLKIFNKSVPISPQSILKESIVRSKQISIPFENDVVTINFALLDYFNVKRNNYSYRLDGFETSWNNIGNRNSATYTNLPPGTYTFIVNASNIDGVKNSEEAKLEVIIVPAFYQTWAFKIILSLIVIGAITSFIHGRTRKIIRQNKILEQHVYERTKDLDKIIIELNQEINVRKKAEEIVKTSLHEKEALLDEKEVLLKEIHHRVKNNLQVISSLLFLSSKKIKDKEALDIFAESQNRVRSITLIHERLYQSKDLGKIDFKEYVNDFAADLFYSYGVDQSTIKLIINIKDIYINTDIAVPCGLIINELITNSLKYAFPDLTDEKERIIKIDFFQEENTEFLLIVCDNGIGIPEGFKEKKKDTLGLQLVETLVSQLNGTLMLDSRQGTTFKIKFNSL